MQGLKIYTKSGEAPTSEEIEFAHRVANQHKEMKFGVITMTDPTSGVVVDYHSYNNTAFTSGDVGAYFGYGASVDMRCWCRGVVLAETAAPAQSVTIARENVVITGHFMGVWNGTFDLVARVNGVEVGRVSGYINRTAGSIGSGQIAPVLEYINGSSGDVGAPTQYAVLTQTASYTWTDYGWVLVSDNKSWSTPFDAAIESALASAAAAANQRSAVFLTDGTELGSAPRSDSEDGNIHFNVLGTTTWRGDGIAPLFIHNDSPESYVRTTDINFTVPDDVCYQKVDAPNYPGSPPISINYNPPQLNFPTIAEVIVGTTGISISESHMFATSNATLDGNTITGTKSITLGAPNGIVSHELVTFREIPHYSSYTTTLNNYAIDSTHIISGTYYQESTENGGSGITIDNTVISINPLYDNIQKQWIADWNAAQEIALTREHNRRKKCSDGQLAYLRNGFLSPEFEYFIKTHHPVSALVRRDIPMELVNITTNLIYEADNGAEWADTNVYTTIYEITVDIRYLIDGAYIEKQLTGTIEKNRKIQDTLDNAAPVEYFEYVFTNTPMANDASGKAFCEIDIHMLSTLYELYADNNLWHDDGSYPLLLTVNGTLLYNPSVVEDDRYTRWFRTAPEIIFGNYSPPLPKTESNLTFTHPQFLYDYIAASKPIEKEVDIDGNKVPVTPSTDWLSSRLAHNEVVTIVPLSFVNDDGIDRGIYPYSRTDEVPAQVKLVGFAKVKYNYFTGSFTFESWTEFTTEGSIKHDGNATYDAETNPTSVNVGGITYTLQPKYFAYDEEYGSTNCVCIAGKTPWTDTKAAYKTQKTNIADIPPEGYTLTDEELLYNEVRKSIK